ncbi:MAG: DUF885 family protein [bacterium]
MSSRINLVLISSYFAMITFACQTPVQEESVVSKKNNYADLVSLFKQFREFQIPKMNSGVPDYTEAAMAKQWRGLKEFQKRLAAIDTSGWPVSQQVEYHLVRAEMNGLEFYHRVLRPWARDPGFYLQSQAGAGPTRYGFLRVPRLPIPDNDLEDFRVKLQAVPEIFEQAKVNLTEGAADLAVLALHYIDEEKAIFQRLAALLAKHHPELVSDAKRAEAAVEDYSKWLKENQHRMTAPAGVGKENYNWWLKNVHLIPYTWEECLDIVMHEDYRMITALELERNRNRHLPQLKPAEIQEEHRRRRDQALRFVMKFLQEEEILSIPDYLDIEGYLHRSPLAAPEEWPRPRDFFEQTGDREPLPEQTHEFIGHYLDMLRSQHDQRPIRGADRFYAIDMVRSEGWAFWLEEMLMHAGYLDQRTRRGREIVYLQAAFRTCRAVADLKMHSNEFSLREAIDYCVECAPNGWLLPDGPHVWYEMETNLRFVGWHMGMVIGKVQLTKLLRDRAKQLGDKFDLREFMDEFLNAGIIPFSLIRWEMTSLDDEIKKLR